MRYRGQGKAKPILFLGYLDVVGRLAFDSLKLVDQNWLVLRARHTQIRAISGAVNEGWERLVLAIRFQSHAKGENPLSLKETHDEGNVCS